MQALRSTLAVLSVLFSGAAALIYGGFGAWFLFIVLALMVCFHLVLLCGSGSFSVHRVAPQQVVAGEPFQVEVMVKRQGFFPVPWITVSDNWHTCSVPLWNRREWRYTYTVPGLPRGLYVQERVRVQCEDWFGWFKRTYLISSRWECTVIPRKRVWPMWRDTSIAAEDTPEVRPYVPGDVMRSIHWKLSAKRGNWVVKKRALSVPEHWLVVLEGKREESKNSAGQSPAYETLLEYAHGFIWTLPRGSVCDFVSLDGSVEPVRARWPQEYPQLQLALVLAGDAKWHDDQRELLLLQRALAQTAPATPLLYLAPSANIKHLPLLTRLAASGRTVYVGVYSAEGHAKPGSLLLTEAERSGLNRLAAAGGRIVVLRNAALLKERAEMIGQEGKADELRYG